MLWRYGIVVKGDPWIVCLAPNAATARETGFDCLSPALRASAPEFFWSCGSKSRYLVPLQADLHGVVPGTLLTIAVRLFRLRHAVRSSSRWRRLIGCSRRGVKKHGGMGCEGGLIGWGRGTRVTQGTRGTGNAG